jgi:mRNA interferase RelE/StbE
MKVIITRAAQKDLKRIDTKTGARIIAKIEQFAADPAALAANVKALKGSDLYRLRVADYRVIYRLDTETKTVTIMVVLTVKHRRDAYE